LVKKYENNIKIIIILKTLFTSLIKPKGITTVILNISVDVLPFTFITLIFRKNFIFVEPPVLAALNPFNKYKKTKIISPPAFTRKRKRLKKRFNKALL